MRVLIVEDEVELSNSIFHYLKSEEYQCDLAYNADEAREQMEIFSYDCIVLDVMLPLGSGLILLQELKSTGKQAGIIIVSAKNSVDDSIKSLNLGADDYLAKPFHLAELSARIQSTIRKRNLKSPTILDYKNISLNLESKEVKINGEDTELNATEFTLFLFLLLNKNKVVSKNAIAENLSSHSALYFDNFDAITSHIKNLKTKLGTAGTYIQAIYSTGYKLE
ncbi:response regulator transcription factor [Pedobacter arcticus]|uniref:response regulator transcription factor n=1 Tax=Pedobacter arcticus TaxID=752140 RepID=UPI0002EE0ED9|nr:response regulator transcription factor [Pedobacter arcticus]